MQKSTALLLPEKMSRTDMPYIPLVYRGAVWAPHSNIADYVLYVQRDDVGELISFLLKLAFSCSVQKHLLLSPCIWLKPQDIRLQNCEMKRIQLKLLFGTSLILFPPESKPILRIVHLVEGRSAGELSGGTG